MQSPLGLRNVGKYNNFEFFRFTVNFNGYYSGTSLQQTCFIADTSLQRTLFLRTNEIMVKVSQKNLFIADRNSGNLSIADTSLQRTPLLGTNGSFVLKWTSVQRTATINQNLLQSCYIYVPIKTSLRHIYLILKARQTYD